MPVSGLVIVLASDAPEHAAALDAIERHPRFTIGPAADGGRVPVVLDASSDAEHTEHMQWLQTLPAVAMVEVAYVDFDDTIAAAPGRKRAGQ